MWDPDDITRAGAPSLGSNLHCHMKEILLLSHVNIDSPLLSRFRPETRSLLDSSAAGNNDHSRLAQETLTFQDDSVNSSSASTSSSRTLQVDPKLSPQNSPTEDLVKKTTVSKAVVIPTGSLQDCVRDLPQDIIQSRGHAQNSRSAPELPIEDINLHGPYSSICGGTPRSTGYGLTPGQITKPSQKKAAHGYLTGQFAWQLDGLPGKYTKDEITNQVVTTATLPPNGKNVLFPEYWADRKYKDDLLKKKSSYLKLVDAKLQSAPASAQVASRPIHVFVDLSNIIIGWIQLLKVNRGISEYSRSKMPAFYFEAFDRLLVRDRPVEKKVLAGSVSQSQQWPDHMYKAEELGYDMNIMQRVLKPTNSPLKTSPKSDGDATSGAEASSEEVFARFPGKYSEQGVDEILHLKMMQSGMDFGTAPATVILATGDAAEAQFSDGFKANVERLLANGWNVEVYAWGHNLSAAWKDKTFRDLWKSQFRLIKLDPFAEELYACYSDF